MKGMILGSLLAVLPGLAEGPQLQLHIGQHTVRHQGLPSMGFSVAELRLRTRGWGENGLNLAWIFGVMNSLKGVKERMSELGGFGGPQIGRIRYTYTHRPYAAIGLQLTWGHDWQVAFLPELRIAETNIRGTSGTWSWYPREDKTVKYPPSVDNSMPGVQSALGLLVTSPEWKQWRLGLRLGMLTNSGGQGRLDNEGVRRRFEPTREVGLYVARRLWK